MRACRLVVHSYLSRPGGSAALSTGVEYEGRPYFSSGDVCETTSGSGPPAEQAQTTQDTDDPDDPGHRPSQDLVLDGGEWRQWTTGNLAACLPPQPPLPAYLPRQA